MTMEIKLEGMTAEQAAAFIKRTYGTYAAYRRAEANYSDAGAQIADIEIQRELQKYNGNVEELAKRDPELYRRYNEATKIRIGNKLKSED